MTTEGTGVDPRRLKAADQLGVVANDVARMIAAWARPLLEGTGVEESAMRIMAEIANATSQGVRPSVLADHLRVDLSTVSRQVQAATQAGLVEVVPDPSDRRATQVRLTSRGAAAYTTIRERRARLLAGLLDRWDDVAVAQLLTLLHELDATLTRGADRDET